jgi:hypothetical protein
MQAEGNFHQSAELSFGTGSDFWENFHFYFYSTNRIDPVPASFQTFFQRNRAGKLNEKKCVLLFNFSGQCLGSLS